MQSVKAVTETNKDSFEAATNKLTKDGYKIKSTMIGRRDCGTYDEYSVFQAILVKEVEDESDGPGVIVI